MADRPKTPPSKHLRSPAHSTPSNPGSGGNVTSAQSHKQEDYAPYLKEDVANEIFISVDDFLRDILRVPNDWTDKRKISETPDFKTKLANYLADVEEETALYYPFVTLANDCLDKLGVGYKTLQFCRNDPVIVRGSKGGRKPDVVNVGAEGLYDGKYDPLCFGDRIGVDDMSVTGPATAFHWRELLSFWEFKLADDKAKVAADEDTAQKAKKGKKVVSAEPKEVIRPDDTAKVAVDMDTAQKAKKGKKKVDSTEPREATRTSLPRTGKAISKTQTPASGSGSGQMRASDTSLAPPSSKKSKLTKEDPRLQCASYALEMLSNGGLRSHVISVLVSRNSLELLYYDRSLVVRSRPLHFAEDTATFISILWGFGSLTRPQRGLVPKKLLEEPKTAVFSDDWKQMYTNHVLNLNGWTLKLEDVIFRAHGIIGRGTVVVRSEVITCPRPDLKGKTVVVKWSWVPKTRTSEPTIVHAALQQAVQNRPKMVHHIPNIYYYEEFADEIPVFLKSRPEYEDRVLRIIVQEELHVITTLTDAAELAQVFKEIFECYRWLFETVKIIHRDISLSNLMFKRMDGRLYGVLNDLDLAIQYDEVRLSTSKQRTGTKPYMARDLLVANPPKHLYRHDLESFLYVLAFLTCDNSSLAKWESLGMEQLRKEKHEALTGDGFPPQQPSFQGFLVWITYLGELFNEGLGKRKKHQGALRLARMMGTPEPTFDDDTLGGSVTFETFSAVLEKPIPKEEEISSDLA
ncbi:hypothetical protein B0H14DRAFT_1458935 [Mycena olivaceomarginata]|nr:hypothetical protein B0H14DRAFT_1458935 [Mycena olivaceomarginata]